MFSVTKPFDIMRLSDYSPRKSAFVGLKKCMTTWQPRIYDLIVSPNVIVAILVKSWWPYWCKKVKSMYKDELLLKNVFAQIFSFVPMNHYRHRSSDCKPSTLLAVDKPSTRKKNSGPLVAHKEKLKEDLSRGNSIAFALFLFLLSLFLALRIFCLFVFV